MPPRTRRKQTSKDTTTAKIEPVETNTNSLNDNNTLPTATTAAITTSETETSKEIYAAESIISSNFTNEDNNENDNNNSNIKNNNDIIDNHNNDDDDDNAIITNNETSKETDISKLSISEIDTNISNSEIEINDNNSSSIKVITATTPTAVTPSATEITFTYESSKDYPSSNVVVKPSGFTCKRITFDEPSDLNKNSNDLSSELERRKKRAERFGTQLSEADKKLERAARFGFAIPSPLDSQLKSPRPSSTPKKMSIVEDEEKLKKRAERFGTNKSTNETTEEITDPTIKFTSPLSSLSEEEKKKKRAERFSSESKSLSSVSPTSLNTISEEEKMKNRAEKFKTNTNDEPPSKKIKT
jgi:hypothetical protein